MRGHHRVPKCGTAKQNQKPHPARHAQCASHVRDSGHGGVGDASQSHLMNLELDDISFAAAWTDQSRGEGGSEVDFSVNATRPDDYTMCYISSLSSPTHLRSH